MYFVNSYEYIVPVVLDSYLRLFFVSSFLLSFIMVNKAVYNIRKIETTELSYCPAEFLFSVAAAEYS